MNFDEHEATQVELFDAASKGDGNAFEIICATVLPKLLSFLRMRCRKSGIPLDVAEDLAQETILRAAAALDRPIPARLSNSFLFSIAKNATLDYIKKKRPLSNQDLYLDSTAGKSLSSEDVVAIREAFAKLNESDREILRMVVIDGDSTFNITRSLNITPNTVYKRYARALAKLRHLLE